MYIGCGIEFIETIDLDVRRAKQFWVTFSVNKISNNIQILVRPPFMETSQIRMEFEDNLTIEYV